MKTIPEKNHVIAVAMGCDPFYSTITRIPFVPKKLAYSTEHGCVGVDELRYHKSWNWLMPVCYQIMRWENMSGLVQLFKRLGNQESEHMQTIEEVHQAVYSYIIDNIKIDHTPKAY